MSPGNVLNLKRKKYFRTNFENTNEREKEYRFIYSFKQIKIIKKVQEEFLLGFVFLFLTIL